MLRVLYKYLDGLPAVYIDGWLYALIAFFGACAAAFSSDESAKFISPTMLYWLRTVCSTAAATLLSIKMFRSTSYSEHREQKRLETQFFTKSNYPNPITQSEPPKA